MQTNIRTEQDISFIVGRLQALEKSIEKERIRAEKMGDAPPRSASSSSAPTVYFGYGSNLWKEQMRLRCPTSEYMGIARLEGYRWIINGRGYANVVEIESSSSSSDDDDDDDEEATTQSEAVTQPVVEIAKKRKKKHDYSNEVWGMVYTLQPDDEDDLDRNEGVPVSYTKEYVNVNFWSSSSSSSSKQNAANATAVDVETAKAEKKEMLVYIDRKRTTPDKPKTEYVYRMNKGIEDALKEGVPKRYVKDVMRKFIPEKVEDGGVEELAMRQAIRFKDENLGLRG